MTSPRYDALLHAFVGNNLSGDALDAATTMIGTDPGKSIDQTLESLLNETIVARACCNSHKRTGNENKDKYVVNVRIPIPDNYDFGRISPSQAILYKKFGYIDKPVYVPASMCSKLDNGVGDYNYNSNTCQRFMYAYCKTVDGWYRNEVAALNTSASDDEFYNYKPECGCYGRQPSYITGAIPPTCYAPGCDPSNSNVFLDTNSRNGCSVTICQTNLDTSGLTAGGSVTINSKVAQQCGNQINKDAVDDDHVADPTIAPSTPTVVPVEPKPSPAPSPIPTQPPDATKEPRTSDTQPETKHRDEYITGEDNVIHDESNDGNDGDIETWQLLLVIFVIAIIVFYFAVLR